MHFFEANLGTKLRDEVKKSLHEAHFQSLFKDLPSFRSAKSNARCRKWTAIKLSRFLRRRDEIVGAGNGGRARGRKVSFRRLCCAATAPKVLMKKTGRQVEKALVAHFTQKTSAKNNKVFGMTKAKQLCKESRNTRINDSCCKLNQL